MPGSPTTIRVIAVLCADGDGSHGAAHGLKEADLEQFFERVDPYALTAGIRFRLNGAVDVVRETSTLLNQDWTIPPGTAIDWASQSRPFTRKDEDAWAGPHRAARSSWAAGRSGRLVVFFRSGTRLAGGPGSWTVAPWQGAYSGPEHQFVAMPHSLKEPNLFAHEVGHYLDLPHTSGDAVLLTDAEKQSLPKKWETTAAGRKQVEDILMPRLRKAIVDHVAAGEPLENGPLALDFDREATSKDAGPTVFDTPPDPGPQLLTALGHADDDAGFTVTVQFPSTERTYAFAPDRRNVMSYFFRNSLEPKGYSADQADRIRWALAGTRAHLVQRDAIPPIPFHILSMGSWPTLITHVLSTAVLSHPALVIAYSRQTGRLLVHRLHGRSLSLTHEADFGDWTAVAVYELGLERWLLAYHADSGLARFSKLRRDGTGIEHGPTARWKTGWSHVRTLGSTGWNRDHLLVYDASTGHVRIDEFAPGGGTYNRWDGRWHPGWTTITPYNLGGGQWRLVVHDSASGEVHLDAIEDPTRRPRTVHETTWPSGLVHFMPYPTPLFGDHDRARMLTYRPVTGSARFVTVADDGFSSGPAQTFATGWSHFVPVFLTPQHDDGDGMLAYRAADGELHIDRLL